MDPVGSGRRSAAWISGIPGGVLGEGRCEMSTGRPATRFVPLVLLLSLLMAGCGASPSTGLRELAESAGPDALPASHLGAAVAVSGHTLAVGAPGWDSETGAVDVFRIGSSGLHPLGQLYGSGAASFDEFGSSVALSGRTLVAGSQYQGGGGRVYVFTRTRTGFAETAVLEASDEANYDQFGAAVAVSGRTMVVGAPGHGLRAGRVYVFHQIGARWRQVAELEGSGIGSNDEFGGAVALSGGTLVAGAQYYGDFVGRVYVFTRGLGRWRQAAALTGRGTTADGYFGTSVAVSGRIVVVGANAEAGAAGRAYVFEDRAGRWGETSVLQGSDTAPVDEFGCSVAVSGRRVLVGGEYHARGAGRAYLFSLGPGGVAERAELNGSDTSPGNDFGAAVALSAHYVVVGAPRRSSSTGEVYVFS